MKVYYINFLLFVDSYNDLSSSWPESRTIGGERWKTHCFMNNERCRKHLILWLSHVIWNTYSAHVGHCSHFVITRVICIVAMAFGSLGLADCSFATILKSSCHQYTWTNGKTGIKSLCEFSPRDRELILWRCDTGHFKCGLKRQVVSQEWSLKRGTTLLLYYEQPLQWKHLLYIKSTHMYFVSAIQKQLYKQDQRSS